MNTDKLDIAYALHRLGFVALAEGCLEEAGRLLQESLTLSRQIRSDAGAAQALRGLGLLALRQGDLAGAESRLRETLALHRTVKDRRSAAEALEALARLRSRQGRTAEAAALYGAADAIRETIDAPVPPCDRLHHSRELASLRAALGPEAFAAAWQEAQQLSTGEMLLSALAL
jgi:tetratricopeptide (TPR) repeat protein